MSKADLSQFLSPESHPDFPFNITSVCGAGSLTNRFIFSLLCSLPRLSVSLSRNTHIARSHSREFSRPYWPTTTFWQWLRSREPWTLTTGPSNVSIPHTKSPFPLTRGITCWTLPLHSPLLRESLEFSFPPQCKMRIISG